MTQPIQWRVPVSATLIPRWYQTEATLAFMDYFIRGFTGSPIIAMPTGAGKSLIIAMIMAHAMGIWPRTRILCLTHVKELIANNVADCLEFWPTAPIGIYSAGLDQKVAHTPIVFGGVKSVLNNIKAMGHRDLVLIDECHLHNSSDDSDYGRVLAGLKEINPHVKVGGLTATYYRTGMGLLTNGKLFTDIVYDMTSMENFNRLIAEGYLAPMITKPTDSHYRVEPVTIDTSQLKVYGEDFRESDVAAIMDVDSITKAAVKETVSWGTDRKSWMTFASGVKHAMHVNSEYKKYGINSVEVYGELGDAERDRRIAAFKRNEIRSLVVNGIGTVGFNHRPIDLIAHMRVTASVGFWVQSMGRMARTSQGKVNGLGLDYAGNTKRLGPINDPLIPRSKKDKGSIGVAPVKICPQCGFYNHTRASICINCGYAFPLAPQLNHEASIDALLRTEKPLIQAFDVLYVLYAKRKFIHSSPFLQVSYHCGVQGHLKYDSRIWLENVGDSNGIARRWWRKFYVGDGTARRKESFPNYVPNTVDEAILLTCYLRTPRTIRVRLDKAEPEVIGHDL